MITHSENRKKKLRSSLFTLAQIERHKYLWFFCMDLGMGLTAWLLTNLVFDPRPLMSSRSLLQLFITLWLFYPAVFFMYEQMKAKSQIK
ncbi:MAG: hypothetical protein LBK03_00170 [Bacteroidales bacterium]|nr:hypothetical protein [Bacteroidales bacterium]